MSTGEVALIAGLVLTFLTILGKVSNFFSWVVGRVKAWRARNSSDLPVRLTCEDANEYHPHYGFNEGYRIEIYNLTAEPVQIKGFGLVLGMTGQAPWERVEPVSGYPLSSFPRWLQPKESWEGYIDTEALGDKLHEEGVFGLAISTNAFVDVSGCERELVDPDSSKDKS